MNVLHICNAYQSNPLYQKLFKCLYDLEIDQDVLAPGDKDGTNVSEGINVYFYKRKRGLLNRLLWPKKIHSLVNFAESSFTIQRYQIIHAHTLFSDGAVAYYLQKKYNSKYVVAVRNTDLNDFFSLPVFKQLGYKILLNASAVYLISEANKRQFYGLLPQKVFQSIKNKVILFPNGIDEFWLSNINKKEIKELQSVSLIYAGDICYNKNIHSVITAIQNSQENIVSSYLAIGLKDADKGKYIKRIKLQEKDSPFFHLLKKCKKEELLCKFRESDIYIQPSFKETFGLSYIEALTQGLPLIYSKNQGIDGFFEDGQVGYSVDPNSSRDIIEKVLLIKKRYCEIINNINSINFQQFSWKNIACDYYNNYMSIINNQC